MYSVTSPDNIQFHLIGVIHCKTFNDLTDDAIDVVSICTSIMTETNLNNMEIIIDTMFPKTSTSITDVLSNEVISYISQYVTIDRVRYLPLDDVLRWLVFVIIYTNYPGINDGNSDNSNSDYAEFTLWNMFDDRYVLEDMNAHITRCQVIVNNLIPDNILQEIRDSGYSLSMITKLVDTYRSAMEQFNVNELPPMDEDMLNNNKMIDALISNHKSGMLVICGLAHIEGINQGLLSNGYTIRKLADSVFK